MERTGDQQANERQTPMSFQNEFISNEDLLRYRLDAVNEALGIDGPPALQWTIDREHDSYLRLAFNIADDARHQSKWFFRWRGNMLVLTLLELDSGIGLNGVGWIHYRLMELVPLGIEVPAADVEMQRNDIVEDLRDALKVYKVGGMFPLCTECDVRLDG